MKIREIRAAGLRGGTPEGGWSEELDPDAVSKYTEGARFLP